MWTPSRGVRFVLRPPLTESGSLFARIRWINVTLVAAALLATTYLVLVTTLFGYVRYQRRVSEVHWLDLALPPRWPRYHAARGDHFIATAKSFAAHRQWREALIYARTGLARAPANRDGRLLLAQLLLGGRRPELAENTLLEGLAFHRDDPAYLEPCFAILLQRQADASLIGLAQDFRRRGAAGEPARLAALVGSKAAFLRGNYDLAEDLLRGVPRLAQSCEGRLLGAKDRMGSRLA